MGMQLTGKGSLVASSLTAIGASVCCVGPLVLLALGVGGTWVGALTMMEPLRPLFIGLTLLFLGLAFRKLYLVPQVCTPGTPCADPRTLVRQRLVFWIVSVHGPPLHCMAEAPAVPLNSNRPLPRTSITPVSPAGVFSSPSW